MSPDAGSYSGVMNALETIPSDTKVVPGAEPLTLVAANSPVSVVLIHGYTGYTGDLYDIARHMHSRGYTMHLPRLPGHGTNSGDFLASDHRMWLRAAVDAYLTAAAWGNPVVVMGHSMGGALAACIAAQFTVAGVALLTPAFQTVSKLVPLAPLLRYFTKPYRKAESEVEDHTDPNLRYMAAEYWDWNWPGPTAELYALIRKGRRALPHITAPTFTLAARKDTAVPAEVIELVRQKLGSAHHQELMLENSGHMFMREGEMDVVYRELYSWLETL